MRISVNRKLNVAYVHLQDEPDTVETKRLSEDLLMDVGLEPIFDTPAGGSAKLVDWVLTLHNHCGKRRIFGPHSSCFPTSDLRRDRLKLLIAFFASNPVGG
jgi:hypothetical protein